MPQTAELDGKRVFPHQASKNDNLQCPVCGDSMTVVDEHPREGSFVMSHFRHENEECPGESKEHLWMKSVACQKLSYLYPDAKVSTEKSIEDRRADILVEFREPQYPLGKGIAVEVQHKNDSKDITLTDKDYYDEGYSVLWLSQQHYSDEDVSVDHVQPVWPNAVPKIRGYDGVSIPVAEWEEFEYEVKFPSEDIIERYQDEIVAAHGKGLDEYNSWNTVETVWLTNRRQPMNTTLEFIEPPQDELPQLRLCKAKNGSKIGEVRANLNESMRKKMAGLAEMISSKKGESDEESGWSNLGKYWLTEPNDDEAVWFRLAGDPDGGYVLEMNRKTATGERRKVSAKFRYDKSLKGLKRLCSTVLNY